MNYNSLMPTIQASFQNQVPQTSMQNQVVQVFFEKDSKYVFIYLFLTAVLGALYMYFIGIREDWQKKRKKHGLCIIGIRQSPKMNDKLITGDGIFLSICVKLLIFSFISTMLINMVHYLFWDNVNIFTFKNLLSTTLMLFFQYSIFGGVPLDVSQVDSGLYKPVLEALSRIKNQIIDGAIIKEQDIYYNYIRSSFEDWNKDDDASKNRMITFVSAVNEKFFSQLFVDDIKDKQKLQALASLPEDIAFGYCNKHVLLSEYLNTFFCNRLPTMGAELSRIVLLVHNHSNRTLKPEEVEQAKINMDEFVSKSTPAMEEDIEEVDIEEVDIEEVDMQEIEETENGA